jgi:hypothetical protein
MIIILVTVRPREATGATHVAQAVTITAQTPRMTLTDAVALVMWIVLGIARIAVTRASVNADVAPRRLSSHKSKRTTAYYAWHGVDGRKYKA